MASRANDVTFGFWNNSDTWDNLGPLVYDATESNAVEAQKLQNFADVLVHGTGESTANMNGPPIADAPSWPVGSVLSAVDIPSIWSNPETFLSEQTSHQGVSESQWMPLNPTNVAAMPWTSAESATVTTCLENAPTGPHLSTLASHTSEANTIESDSHTQVTTDSSSRIESSHSQPSSSYSQSVSPTSEQLYAHLINSNEGWGTRPVNQSTPWDIRPYDHNDSNGFATPTPGRYAGVTGASQSHMANGQRTESNIWKSEPPTGTAIWEMYYSGLPHGPAHSAGSLPTVFSSTSLPLAATSLGVNAPTTFSRPIVARSFEANKFKDVHVPPNGRPVLGGTRNASGVDNALAWSGDGSSSTRPNRSALNTVPQWDGSMFNQTGTTWGPAIIDHFASFPPDDSSHTSVQPSVVDRHPMSAFSNIDRYDATHPFPNETMRKVDGVHSALVECNTDVELTLQQLRERYSGGVSTNLFPPCTIQPPSSVSQLQALRGQSTSAIGSQVNRNKPGTPGVVPNNQLSGLPANPHFIRQQLTQQVRSALSLASPNPGNASGNSLLGQPPPLFNGTQPPPQHNRPVNGTLRSASNISSNFVKRSERPAAVSATIQELQKKHQSIQQQLLMYRNDPNVCSQPQYADVFTELQSQLQLIEAQMRAKHTQMNFMSAPDFVTSGRSAADSRLYDESGARGNLGKANNNNNNQPHEQLVQQLMDLNLRPGTTDLGDEFPTIGMWNASNRSTQDVSDKPTISDTPVSKSNQRRNQNNWSGNNWNTTSNNRSGGNWNNGFRYPGEVASTPLSSGTQFRAPPIGLPERPQVGQWLLVSAQLTDSNSLHTLHSLLSQFGLTNFHVLGPSSGRGLGSGSSLILVHLQSREHALQLIRAVGDRLALEPISDMEASNHLQNVTKFCRDTNVNAPNQSNWFNNADQYNAPSAQFISKRMPPATRGALSRNGVISGCFP